MTRIIKRLIDLTTATFVLILCAGDGLGNPDDSGPSRVFPTDRPRVQDKALHAICRSARRVRSGAWRGRPVRGCWPYHRTLPAPQCCQGPDRNIVHPIVRRHVETQPAVGASRVRFVEQADRRAEASSQRSRNLIGMGTPMLVGIMTIPYLIRSLGTDRFGVLTLAWSLIGYFSLFDFGLGRTLTQAVAERLGTGREQDVPVVLWTALTLMIVLGLVGLLAGAMLTPWIVRRVLRIPTSLEAETITAFLILALSVPATIATSGLRGALEAYHRFGLTSGLRAAMGIFTFLAPACLTLLAEPRGHRRRVTRGASGRLGRPRRGLSGFHDRGGWTEASA